MTTKKNIKGAIEWFKKFEDDANISSDESNDELNLPYVERFRAEKLDDIIHRVKVEKFNDIEYWFDADDDESEEDNEDGELIETAIDRLTGSDDPVGLSHVVGGVVQLTGDQRQELLSAPDAVARLALLVRHLQRENLLLAEGVRPWSADARALAERRN